MIAKPTDIELLREFVVMLVMFGACQEPALRVRFDVTRQAESECMAAAMVGEGRKVIREATAGVVARSKCEARLVLMVEDFL